MSKKCCNINLNLSGLGLDIEERIKRLETLIGKLNMNDDELAQELAAAKELTQKIFAEVSARIKKLEDAVMAAGNVPENVIAELNGLKSVLANLDNVVPDAPVETPV